MLALKDFDNGKRIAKNTLLLYVRMLFSMAISLYTSRVILRVLGVDDFGIYNVVGGVVLMFTFLNSSMSAATQRFFAFALGQNNVKQIKAMFSTSLAVHCMLSVIIILLGETVGLWFLLTQMTIPEFRMNAAVWVYQFAILSTVVLIMTVPYNAVIIAYEKMNAFAYISILEVAFKLLIVYVLIFWDFDKLKLYAVLMFCVQLVTSLIYILYCRSHFLVSRGGFIRDKELLCKMIYFAGWTMNGNLAVIAYTQGLNILLNMYFGPVVNAARGIAVQVQNAMMAFCRNFQMAVNPQITKNYAKNDLYRMHQLIYASSKYSFFLLFILSFPVMLETLSILSIWLDVVPAYTVVFLRIMLLILLLESLSNPMIISIHATGDIKRFQLYEGGILLLIVPFSFVVLKMGFPPYSVFVVQLLLAVIVQGVRLRIVCPKINMSLREYNEFVICRILKVVLPVSCLSLLLKIYICQQWGIVCICCVIFTLVGIYCWGLNVNERAFLKKKLAYSSVDKL